MNVWYIWISVKQPGCLNSTFDNLPTQVWPGWLWICWSLTFSFAECNHYFHIVTCEMSTHVPGLTICQARFDPGGCEDFETSLFRLQSSIIVTCETSLNIQGLTICQPRIDPCGCEDVETSPQWQRTCWSWPPLRVQSSERGENCPMYIDKSLSVNKTATPCIVYNIHCIIKCIWHGGLWGFKGVF